METIFVIVHTANYTPAIGDRKFSDTEIAFSKKELLSKIDDRTEELYKFCDNPEIEQIVLRDNHDKASVIVRKY
jgi:cellobiose phosphorylase